MSERKSLGFATVMMKVAVNDAGRAIGEDHAGAKYLDSDVDHARELRVEGYTLREISKMLENRQGLSRWVQTLSKRR